MSPPAATLSEHLRAETREAHQALEEGLDLLRPPLDQGRFRRVLEGFRGFHAAWEPAIAATPAGPWITPRVDLLDEDLQALGLTAGEITRLPIATGAAALTADRLRAWGSAYVMEGSALGGQLISRALAEASWRPEGGLRYFNPYGAETGGRWRSFKAALDAAAAPPDWPAVVAGARSTFDTLRLWLTREPTAAPHTLAGDRP